MVVEDLEATDETVVVDSRGHHLLEHGHVFLVGLLVDVGEVLGEASGLGGGWGPGGLGRF